MPATERAAAETIEQRVVDAALAIAGEVGWEQVRLSAIADRTELPLAEIGRHFRDVDAIANAWFARARLAMLALPREELTGRPADERIALAFDVWLDSLAPHRQVVAEVLRHKLYPSHPHHWVPLVFDLSRFVHDLLDVARVPGSGRLRQAQEIGLTAITLLTLADWLRDDSPARNAASSVCKSASRAPVVSPGACRRRSGLVPPCQQDQPRQPSHPPPRRALDVEALLQRDLRHE
jgi:AcrR family transcriptional regulator